MGARRQYRPSSLSAPGYLGMLGVLIAAREKAGLTQAQLAERMGRHRSFVWKTEGRLRRLDLVEFVRWSHACGLDPVEAFKEVLKQLPDKAPPPKAPATVAPPRAVQPARRAAGARVPISPIPMRRGAVPRRSGPR